MPQCGEDGSAVRVSILSFGLQDHLFVPVLTRKPRLFGGVFVFPGSRVRHRPTIPRELVPDARDLMSMPIVTVTRRLRFNAAHRVHNPTLSDAENTRLFGKCNNPNWHGHNYALEVSVRGPIDERTGYVIDLGQLRDVVEREVIEQTDHRNFNIDVPYMQGINPTTENVVVAMWQVLAPAIAPAQLIRLRLWETENNYVDYEGE